MLNTRKLLYILPDVAYVAELLPTKKEHTFSIQSFRQINGEFLNEDDDLIAENIDKLLSKLDPDTYHLILPDFVFTNTILEIKETQDSKIKDYIKENLLPSLDLNKNTHEISTFVLTQYGGVSKIQLTALEKSVLDPIVTSSQTHRIEIDQISPLSWTIKSVISLEPSISVIQIGSILYAAEHYIGIDQCTMAKVTEIENIEETIKTLKGAQPSIQTIYLLTNALVEEKLKEKVSKTLPIQQLAIFKDEETQMPSYVKKIIESGMKTLDIADFPVPLFSLPKTVSGLSKTKTEKSEAPEDEDASIKPKSLNVFDVSEDDDDLEDDELPLPTPVTPEPTPIVGVVPAAAALAKSETEETPETTVVTSSVTHSVVNQLEIVEGEVIKDQVVEEIEKKDSITTSLEDDNLEEPDLSVFAPPRVVEAAQSAIPDSETSFKTSNTQSETGKAAMDAPSTERPNLARPIIKNREGNNLVKGLAILVATLAITMAIGAGIGFAVLRLTNSLGDEQVAITPTTSPSPVVVSPTPSPSPSPSPSPIAIKKDTMNILVVNATTTPGYAGSTKTKLEKAGFKSVKATNAKGEYEPGTYVLMKTQDSALISTLEKDSGLALSFASGIATEDPKGEYEAVIVLAK